MAFSNTLFSFSSHPIVPNNNQHNSTNIRRYLAFNKNQNQNQNPNPDFNLVAASKDYKVLHEERLKEVSLEFKKTENQVDRMIMIDTFQQFGIDYHFDEEIQDVLSRQYTSLMAAAGGVVGLDDNNNLFNVSLCFRLLRQSGYPVPTDVFDVFLDFNGNFRHELSNDLCGMMGLYQASQLGMEGEDILDQAKAFTSKYLRESMPRLNRDQASIISDTLDHPYHESLPRLYVKKYIKYHETLHGRHGFRLQQFAKLDFNIVQSLHCTELEQVFQWWKDLGLRQQLGFARDQPLKWYMWSLAVLADPVLTEERVDLTKAFSFVYIMDDIFDVYGTFDELVLFSEAINKWEIDTVQELPNSMKIFLKAFYDTTDEISNKFLKRHGWNPINLIKRAWVSLCNAFLVEAKWFASGHLPTSEEYLKNGVISSGVDIVFVHTFLLLGQGINEDTSASLVDSIPGLMSYPATILRLWDDLGSAKDENQHGYDGSYLDCYMKENNNSTFTRTREHVLDMISNSWKKLYREYVSPSPFSLSFKKASLNFARMVYMMYNYDENQCLPTLEEHMRSMFYESIPLHEI